MVCLSISEQFHEVEPQHLGTKSVSFNLFLPFKDECSLTICDWVHCLPYHILPPSVLLCPSPSRLLPFIELLLSSGSEKGTETWVFGELWQNESFFTIFFSGEGSTFLMVKIITSQFSLTWL